MTPQQKRALQRMCRQAEIDMASLSECQSREAVIKKAKQFGFVADGDNGLEFVDIGNGPALHLVALNPFSDISDEEWLCCVAVVDEQDGTFTTIIN